LDRAILGGDDLWADRVATTSAQRGSAWQRSGRSARILTIAAVVSCACIAWIWANDAPAVTGTASALGVLTAAALVDAQDRRLPNMLVGLGALPVGVAAAVAAAAGSTGVAIGAGVGAALVSGPLLAAHLVSPTGMGFGDVKAGAVLGGAVGLVSTPSAVLALLLALAGSGLWAVVRRRRTIALGPGMVAGALVALFVARIVGVEAN